MPYCPTPRGKEGATLPGLWADRAWRVPLICPSFPGAFEDLKKDPEPSIRYFASRQASFLQKVVARPQ